MSRRNPDSEVMRLAPRSCPAEPQEDEHKMMRAAVAHRWSIALWAIAMLGLPLTSTAALAQKFNVTPLAEKKIAQLPPGPWYWRIDNFPNLAQAEAAAGPTALAAQAEGKAWLFTLGPPGGSSPGGSKVA